MKPEDINRLIDEKIAKAMAFGTSKYGDIPTDALQLTPKKYVTSVVAAAVSSITSAAGGADTDVQVNRGGVLYGNANLTMTSSVTGGFDWGGASASILSVGAYGDTQLELAAGPDGGIVLGRNGSSLDVRTIDNADGNSAPDINIEPGNSWSMAGADSAAVVRIIGGDDGTDGGGDIFINAGRGTRATSVVGAVNINTNPNSSVFGTTKIGGRILTGAVTGHMYIPTCAGTPTSSLASAAPVVYDTTANKIWVYNGSWRSVAVT